MKFNEMLEFRKRDLQAYMFMMIGIIGLFISPWVTVSMSGVSCLLFIIDAFETSGKMKKELLDKLDIHNCTIKDLRYDFEHDGGKLAKEIVELRSDIEDIKTARIISNEN